MQDATTHTDSVIGADFAVTKVFPPYVIAVEVPKRVILFNKQIIKKFLAIKRWCSPLGKIVMRTITGEYTTMKINILHINANYIYSNLHQCMLDKLNLKGTITNKTYVATYNKSLGIVCPTTDVTISECFKKWDKLVFDFKQNKICKTAEKHFNIKSFDIIHAYTLFTDGNCARKLYKKYGVPYVVAVRNTDVNDFFRKMIHLRSRGVKIMLDAKAVFFLSEAYRSQVFDKYVPKKYHEELKKKTHIIPNGIDDFWFKNHSEDENVIKTPLKLMYAGRIDRNKNIPSIQKAISILAQKGIAAKLTVVGKVADKKLFDEIKNDPNTTCLDPMPKEKLISLYREHNIFVMPSFTESFGLVYAEAMSQGLPVIYSKGQGFDRQFPEGTVGFHVDAHDVNDIACGIEKLTKDFERIKKNVVSCSKGFNWLEITDEYNKIYTTILSES